MSVLVSWYIKCTMLCILQKKKLKWTGSVISLDKDGNAWFTAVSWNLNLEKNFVFLTRKLYFILRISPLLLRNAQLTFTEKPQMKINSSMKQKHWYIILTWSDKALMGTVVNRALSSLHGESQEFTHSVPLIKPRNEV